MFLLCSQRLYAAEDIAQEAFADGCRLFQKLREPATFSRWLRRILFKHCDLYLRRRRIESLEGAALESLATDEETLFRKLERRDRMRLVGEAMHGLNQEEPTAIVLYYFNDYSYRQIEEFLEVSETTSTIVCTQAIKS